MTALATRVMPQLETTTLVVVFPGLALLPQAMVECVGGFRGSRVVVVNGAAREISGIPLELQSALERQAMQAKVQMIYSGMFGNRCGLTLPVDLAVQVVTIAQVQPADGRIRLTGCYRGWLPGSIDVLAEALSALHFQVELDARISRR
ncbi:MAG: hypothetical protein VW600_15100 [Ferrovibrio sp.]